MTTLEAAAVVALGAVSAFIGTTVGGGGLIAIPGLLLLGLPPHMAVATTRIGALGLHAAGLFRFRKDDCIDWRIGLTTGAFALAGAVVGARLLLGVPAPLLEKIIGLLLLAVGPLLLTRRTVGLRPRQLTPVQRAFGYLLHFPIGIWGGFLGAGYGMASSLVMLLLEGKTFLQAAATRKLPALGVTLVALVIFAEAQVLAWAHGLLLLLGMALGSYAGASYGLRRGNRWVRRLFIVVIVIPAIHLLA